MSFVKGFSTVLLLSLHSVYALESLDYEGYCKIHVKVPEAHMSSNADFSSQPESTLKINRKGPGRKQFCLQEILEGLTHLS